MYIRGASGNIGIVRLLFRSARWVAVFDRCWALEVLTEWPFVGGEMPSLERNISYRFWL